MPQDLIKVWTREGQSMEIEREKCILLQRSAIVQPCDRKRWTLYHGGSQGKGVDGRLRPDDLELGAAVHKGMERMFDKGLAVGVASSEARLEFESKRGRLLIAEDPWLEEAVPEVYEELLQEQAYLAGALVAAFGARHRDRILAEYEVVSLEEEINWVVGETNEGKYLVMMSRPDGVVRGRRDGRLYVVSHKTTKKFHADTIEKLSIDPQAITEGLAVQSRYGEVVGGTVYFYFIKGDRKRDENGYKRYENSLVRPWVMMSQVGGRPSPQMFAMVGKWAGVEGEKGGSLGKGWERGNVWEFVDFNEWLGWLDKGLVQAGLGRDWLGEAVAEPLVEVWNEERAEEFVARTGYLEQDWQENLEALETFVDNASLKELKLTQLFPKVESQCHNFNKRCQFFDVCWGGQTLEQGLASGRWVVRTPNHLVEERSLNE